MCEGFRVASQRQCCSSWMSEEGRAAGSGAGTLDRRSVPRHWGWECAQTLGATREPQEPAVMLIRPVREALNVKLHHADKVGRQSKVQLALP